MLSKCCNKTEQLAEISGNKLLSKTRGTNVGPISAAPGSRNEFHWIFNVCIILHKIFWKKYFYIYGNFIKKSVAMPNNYSKWHTFFTAMSQSLNNNKKLKVLQI